MAEIQEAGTREIPAPWRKLLDAIGDVPCRRAEKFRRRGDASAAIRRITGGSSSSGPPTLKACRCRECRFWHIWIVV